ncbi:hypothetical protein ZIOFF_035039 [Zingiber officinale]|uniref:Remorin C-terminal domain-containing protein n=1 Tax=Zingiber officinale TaxID=94328 RepID=A0A8J5L2D3_ZINOF|nr:hypothetical protein ZIOFF_035039 [Zingiber officinale]
MLNDPRPRTAAAAAAAADHEDATAGDAAEFRDIHVLAPPTSHLGRGRGRLGDLWEGGSVRSAASLSVGSAEGVNEGGFTSMSREFNAMVVAGSNFQQQQNDGGGSVADDQLTRIGEDELEEINPLAIVPDNNPFPSPRRPSSAAGGGGESSSSSSVGVPVHVVKKEEVETKIAAWQVAEVAKINNRFKREEVVINGWENNQTEKATTWLKKVEQRKLDEQRAKATEKMQNDVARAQQKAAERRASAESKRGTKITKVLELANFMRAVGRAPSKRSFF